MDMLYETLGIALSAAFVAYFFYPLLAMPFFGVLWLLFPSRRPTTTDLFRYFVEPAPDTRPLVFILTFIWLFLLSIK